MFRTLAVTSFTTDLLLAVFHKVGPNVHMRDNGDLHTVFNEAAKGGFVQFKWHPQYHYSEHLLDALRLLTLGSSITRTIEGTFYVSEHTLGPYGEKKFEALSPEDQETAEEIAKALQDRFHQETTT